MASGTLWNEKTIHSGQPIVVSTATYEYERVGTQLKIKIDTANHCTSTGAYWDWRWAFKVTVNGTDIASNIQLKPRTYLNIIGRTVYSGSTGWATVDIGGATEVNISITYFDTEANNNSKMRSVMGSGSFTLKGIPALPSVSLSANQSYPNKTNNSIKVNYSVTGNYEYVRVYLDGQKYRDVTSSPFNVTGLSPNTTHKIYAKAYGNGAFGSDSNTITFTTYLTPSSVSSSSVGEIDPFNATAYCGSNNNNNTSLYEYALCDINKNVIQGPFTTKNSYYNFTGLNEETSYYIRYRVQSKDSGAWSNYVYSPLFTTPADQARSYLKANGSWKKGKTFYKNNNEWKKVKKAYIKINGQWVLAINEY